MCLPSRWLLTRHPPAAGQGLLPGPVGGPPGEEVVRGSDLKFPHATPGPPAAGRQARGAGCRMAARRGMECHRTRMHPRATWGSLSLSLSSLSLSLRLSPSLPPSLSSLSLSLG